MTEHPKQKKQANSRKESNSPQTFFEGKSGNNRSFISPKGNNQFASSGSFFGPAPVVQRKHNNQPLDGQQEEQNTKQPTHRIRSNGNVNEYALRNARGDVKQLESGEEIYLPEGTEVAVLDSSGGELHGYYKIALWYAGTYHTGFIHLDAIYSGKGQDITEFSPEIFISDAENTVYRSRTRVEQEIANASNPRSTERQYQQVLQLISDVECYIGQYRNGQLVITPEILQKLVEREAQFDQLKAQDKVAGVNVIAQTIFNGYDPIVQDKDYQKARASDITLFVPLSFEWFQSATVLQNYYDTVIANAEINKFEGHSGEGIMVDDTVIQELMDLRAFVGNALAQGNLNHSSETEWLRTLNPSKIAQYSTLIFVHDSTWNLTADQRRTDGINAGASFGPVNAHPMKSVLTHEVNVNTTGYLVTDTHIKPDQEQQAQQASQITEQRLKKEPLLGDAVYQSESYLATVILHDYFKQIESFQQR